MDDAAAVEPVAFSHRPVLLERTVELFAPVPAGWVVDATLGGAGHAKAILDAHPHLSVLGLDQDHTAIAAATAALAPYGERARVVHLRFDRLAEAIADLDDVDPRGVSGVLFDLGVSSPQLDRAERGFSFRHSGPLDMRMDRRREHSASDVVNQYSAERLAETLDRYGDERYARRIASAIVAARPIETTGDLAEVVASAIPAPARRKYRGHPARRTFQAIRIEVNDELAVLASAINQAVDALMPGGRCVAMSYHSGEDRLVKERFRQAVTGGCECPPRLPCVCGAEPSGRLVRRGAQKASVAEIDDNPRAESVRLRVLEKLDEKQAS